MIMEKTIIQKLLFDYFEGRATSMQRILIEDWLKEDTANEVLFYQNLDAWESQNPQYMPDESKAWTKFESVLNAPLDSVKEEIQNEHSTPGNWRKFWLLAASVGLFIVSSMFFFQKTILYRTYDTGNAEMQSITLADGTTVTLNANSTLYVPRWGFSGSKRVVLLDGEGEFNVTHTADNKTFVIKTDSDFEVEVFGTQFIFYARDHAKKVVLNEGKVQINYEAGKQQILMPGDVVTLNADSKTLELTKTDNPKKYSAWKDHQFYFDDTPLSEAAMTIKEHFGLDIIFKDPALRNRRLSGYFKAEKADDLFKALSLLLNIEIQHQADSVTIYSKQ